MKKETLVTQDQLLYKNEKIEGFYISDENDSESYDDIVIIEDIDDSINNN